MSLSPEQINQIKGWIEKVEDGIWLPDEECPACKGKGQILTNTESGREYDACHCLIPESRTFNASAPDWLQQLLDTVEAQTADIEKQKHDYAVIKKAQEIAVKDLINAADEVEQLRAEVAEADGWCEYWRREAFRKYPTPEAYEAACIALQKHRERADAAEAEVERLTAIEQALKDFAPTRGMFAQSVYDWLESTTSFKND